MKKSVFIFIAAASLTYCTQEKEVVIPTEDREMIMTVQKETMSAMKSGMMKVLFEQVEKKGFADSVKYCSDFAPEGGKTLNQKLSEKFKNELNLKNFSFRRTSLKYRNPNNAPDELEKKVLTSWIDLYNDGKEIKPHIEPAANGYRVLVPMLVPTVTCLGCHGTPDSIDSEAVKVIDELYPEDKAKGFVVGDLRGAISLQIEK